MKYPITLLYGLPAFLLIAMTLMLPSASNPALKKRLATVRGSEEAVQQARVQAFLKKNCIACHGPQVQRSGLRLDTLAPDFADRRTAPRWLEIRDRIVKGEMPPPGSPRPAPAASAQITAWITTHLQATENLQERNGGRVALRRLNRREYENTVRDLFDMPIPLRDDFPEDPPQFGFDTIGATLQISPTLMNQYLAVASRVVNQALMTGPRPRTNTVRYDPGRLDFRISNLGASGVDVKNLRMHRGPCLPEQGTAGIPLEFYGTGLYKIRIRLSGVHEPEQPAPHLTLRLEDPAITFFDQDVEAPENEPVTLETTVWVPGGVLWAQLRNEVDEKQPRIDEMWTWKDKQTGKLLAPMLFIDWMELEGPLYDQWPAPAYQRVFFKGPGVPKDKAYAREILQRFMDRAYRRPATAEEVGRMVSLAQAAIQRNESFEESIKIALEAVLCSPNFLYLAAPPAAQGIRSLTGYELASRLSYFLWSTMPDDALRQAAASGTLHDPKVMTVQVERMLKDPKASALTNDFAYQWLQLYRVGQFQPDRRLYPAYDLQVQNALIGETKAFFQEILDKNLSVLNFIHSDWTMLNGRAAEFYDIPGVRGDGFRRVALKPSYHRGGVLTQASILSLTSDGVRHRPVHRGVWMLNAFLNTPPPPPPPNVPSIDSVTSTTASLTVRGRMAAHRTNEVCASCHRKIDPLGLAFEHYDAVGRWRETEKALSGTAQLPLDASGQLPDGRRFDGAVQLQSLLLKSPAPFLHALSEKMLIYALGRGLQYSDQATVSSLQANLQRHDDTLKGLIIGIACSKPFQTK